MFVGLWNQSCRVLCEGKVFVEDAWIPLQFSLVGSRRCLFQNKYMRSLHANSYCVENQTCIAVEKQGFLSGIRSVRLLHVVTAMERITLNSRARR